MKLKSPFLLLILLIFTYLTIVHSSFIIKPFNYIKDLLFYSVHAYTSDLIFSSDLADSIISSLIEDINNLKKLNNINLSISEYDIINATVIERNREYWFNTLTINKGSADGIKIDMSVIDSNGLVGRISMVNKYSSQVKLITTNDTKNKISAVIKANNVYGIINGYDYSNNYLYLTITDNKQIDIGSKVETTGMGGVFPSGILIGNVIDIIKKDDGITNIVRIKPSSNIEGERYVSIIKRKEIINN